MVKDKFSRKGTVALRTLRRPTVGILQEVYNQKSTGGKLITLLKVITLIFVMFVAIFIFQVSTHSHLTVFNTYTNNITINHSSPGSIIFNNAITLIPPNTTFSCYYIFYICMFKVLVCAYKKNMCANLFLFNNKKEFPRINLISWERQDWMDSFTCSAMKRPVFKLSLLKSSTWSPKTVLLQYLWMYEWMINDSRL